MLSVPHRRKMRPREMKAPVQGHTDSKGQDWNLNPKSLSFRLGIYRTYLALSGGPLSPGLLDSPLPVPNEYLSQLLAQSQDFWEKPAWLVDLSEGLALPVLGIYTGCVWLRKVGHPGGGGDCRCGLKTFLPPSTPPGQQSHRLGCSKVSSNDLGNS